MNREEPAYHLHLNIFTVHRILDRYHRAAFMRNAIAAFAAQGVKIKRVMTDNGSCYRLRLFAQTIAEAGISHKRTRPYRPQTNGKVEPFNRIIIEEWAYARAL